MSDVRERFGTLTTLFLNAGVNRPAALDACDEAAFDDAFAVNTKGQFFTLEFVLAPFGIVVADHWVDALKEIAGVPSEWVKQVGDSIADISKLIRAGKSPAEPRPGRPRGSEGFRTP